MPGERSRVRVRLRGVTKSVSTPAGDFPPDQFVLERHFRSGSMGLAAALAEARQAIDDLVVAERSDAPADE